MELDTFAPFGVMLKDARQRKGITQQQIADKLGVHRNTIGSWERSDYLPEHRGIVLELAKQLRLGDREALSLLEASLTAVAPFWSVPTLRNPFFTGREDILEEVHACLSAYPEGVITQSYALYGMGGIGKTQVAVEYACLYALEYTAVLWVDAGTSETISSSFLRLAEHLQLPERREVDHQQIVAAVQRWLIAHDQWLLIWDNLEEREPFQRFFTPIRQGAILITTRQPALGSLAHTRELLPMTTEEGYLLLVRRSKVSPPAMVVEQIVQHMDLDPAAEQLTIRMGGLPLALDQAGAYIEETGCSIADYLQRYEKQRARLLDRRGTSDADHSDSVTATFRLIWQRIVRDHHMASDVLRMCAFLHVEAIPEELFVTEDPSSTANPLMTDPYQFDLAMATLRSYSLVQRHAETHTFSLHRLVQAVLQEELSNQERIYWQQYVIGRLNTLFPDVTYLQWSLCERLLGHVLISAAMMPEHVYDPLLAEGLRKAGDYLYQRGQYEQAEPLYQRALRIQEHVPGPEHSQTIASLYSLALLYRQQGKYERAETLFQRVLSIRELTLGLDHTDVAHALNGLATVYTQQGKHERAEPLYQRALHIREQVLGLEHPEVSVIVNNLASTYKEQGKYAQAEAFYQRALYIRELAWGPEHPDVSFVLNNLGEIYRELGKYAQAEALYQRALNIWEQALGPEHPRLALALNNLATLFFEQEQYAQAESFYQRALRIWEQTLGSDHHFLAHALNGLAEIYGVRREYEQAELLFKRALYICEQRLGLEHPDVAYPLNSLAEMYMKWEKYEESEALYQQALQIREQQLGLDHPKTAITLHHLAILYQTQGKYAPSELLYQRAIAIYERQLGFRHPKTIQACKDYDHLNGRIRALKSGEVISSFRGVVYSDASLL